MQEEHEETIVTLATLGKEGDQCLLVASITNPLTIDLNP